MTWNRLMILHFFILLLPIMLSASSYLRYSIINMTICSIHTLPAKNISLVWHNVQKSVIFLFYLIILFLHATCLVSPPIIPIMLKNSFVSSQVSWAYKAFATMLVTCTIRESTDTSKKKPISGLIDIYHGIHSKAAPYLINFSAISLPINSQWPGVQHKLIWYSDILSPSSLMRGLQAWSLKL